MCSDVVILAGGAGERLWPVSTDTRPKQFLRIAGGTSFLQSAILRAWNLSVSGVIYIITRDSWIDLVVQDILDLAERENLPLLPQKTVVIGEPFGKNTAPALALISRILETDTKDTHANLLVMASDHVINDTDAFTADVETASWFGEQGNLVSFALPPRYPSTGYGYIQAGESLSCPCKNAATAFVTDSFREKPDEETAKQYLETGTYFWNSGLYLFRCDMYLAELEKHAPEIAAAFAETITLSYTKADGISIMRNNPDVTTAYKKTPSVSIDYAVSEKCDRSVSVAARFDWDDVGSWDSLIHYLPQTEATCVQVDSDTAYVNSDIPVALCGMDDCIVVIRDGKALVARKGQSNLVKNALAAWKNKESR